MKRLTKKEIFFPKLEESGHLYQGTYIDKNGPIAIVIGERGTIGKLSVNLADCDIPKGEELKKNEFYVRLYAGGGCVNKPCYDSGLFAITGTPFECNYGLYQRWKIKSKVVKNG